MGNPVRQEWCGPPIDGEASAAINALNLWASETVQQVLEACASIADTRFYPWQLLFTDRLHLACSISMDNVIENRDAQNLSSLREPIGDLNILSAWFWITGWMIVREQDGSGTLNYG